MQLSGPFTSHILRLPTSPPHSTANPAYTHDELVHQLRSTGTKLIISHPTGLAVAEAAARTVGLPTERIVLVDKASNGTAWYAAIPDLVQDGLKAQKSYTERKLKPGEGRTKIAFLNFSSGTTGLPKVRFVWMCYLVRY